MGEFTPSDHAKALSSSGAAKGGKARADKLTPEERREIARKAAEKRWGDLPRATHTGTIVIADKEIACAVLKNGKRLLTQETFLTTIGRAAKAKGGRGSERLTGTEWAVAEMPPFLAENLRPFVTDRLLGLATPIVFRNASGRRAYGYDATLLPAVCDVYLNARDAGKVLRSQSRIVVVCDLLMRGLAHIGIISLVDEATGYQADRDRDELGRILAAYINEELRPWIRMFPSEFFEQIHRIHGWHYDPMSTKRTPQIGKLINKWIYEQLPPGVLTELQSKNPVTESGYRRHKHHQFLTEHTGNKHLDKQIAVITMMMRISENREDFDRHFERAFAKSYQQRLPLVVDVA
ncbi:MAG: P63C domain-containing protein [Chloroflexota bacterium]|nr:P63C domain-containing protein [Chloroflexota bacterium]